MAETLLSGPLKPNRLVNRTQEIDAIRAALEADAKPRIFYFEAAAGVGKTRLLQEAEKEALKFCRFGGFYDFYDTELHSNSRLEQRILEFLDPKQEYFSLYRTKRDEFQKARRTAPAGSALETMRVKLGSYFVEGINELSAGQKILFCFDTLETLQYESDTIQSLIGHEIAKDAIETLGWLTRYLPGMRNVVILLAGREKPGLIERLKEAFDTTDAEFKRFDLKVFTAKYVREYLQVMADTYSAANQLDVARQMRRMSKNAQRVHTLTSGQPILLSFVTDLLHYRRTLPDEFKSGFKIPSSPKKKKELQTKIKDDLLTRVMNDIHNDIAQTLEYIALTRKGITADLLEVILSERADGWDRERCQTVLEQLRVLSYAKPIENSEGKLERMYLHDEVYDWIGERLIQPHIDGYKPVYEQVVQYYNRSIAENEQKVETWREKEDGSAVEFQDLNAALDERDETVAQQFRLIAKRLYYQLEMDPYVGYKEYSRISDRAIVNHQVGLDMMLRDEMLRYFDLQHLDNWRLKRAERVQFSRLTPARFMRGAGIRWVQRLIAQGHFAAAIETSRRLQVDTAARAELQADDDFLFNPILKTYQGEALLTTDTGTAIAVLTEAINEFHNAQAKLPTEDMKAILLPRHLGRALNNRGYALVRENRYVEAIEDYKRALPRLRATGLPHQTAGTIINLAFAYINTGHLLAAETLCREAIRLCDDHNLKYLKGLGLNTLALADLEADRPHRAIALAQQAIQNFEALTHGGERRGIGLANLVLGKANRARAKLGIYSRSETLKFLSSSQKELLVGWETFNPDGPWPEASRELEARQQLGCLYRQWARFEKDINGNSPLQFARHIDKANENFQAALALAAIKYVGMRADILNDIAELHYVQGDAAQTEATLNESDEAVRASSPYYFIATRRQPEDPIFHLYTLLGKNELLRARMALHAKLYEEAARHYTLASAYFDRLEGDQSARELSARRTYRIYRDLVDARLDQEKLQDFKQTVEKFQRQALTPPWPRRTTTLSDSFDEVLADLVPVLNL